MNDNGRGNTGAIDGLTRFANANVIDLRTQRQEWRDPNVHSAAKAESKVIGGTEPGSTEMCASNHALGKGTDPRRIPEHQARAKKERRGIRGHTSRRRVIVAKITSKAQPVVVERNGSADAVLIEAIRVAQAEIGVANGCVDGLRVRWNGEEY